MPSTPAADVCRIVRDSPLGGAPRTPATLTADGNGAHTPREIYAIVKCSATTSLPLACGCRCGARVFGEEPENPRLISIPIDSNDTRSAAESLIGLIQFVAR